MNKYLLKSLKLLLISALIAGLLSACGQSVQDTYPLESVYSNGNQTSYVYRAHNQTVPEVANDIKSNRQPNQMSETNLSEMFLVYDTEWYNIQQDPDNPSDSLIEVDNIQFVQNNYDSSFLQAYIAAELIDELFDSLEHSSKNNRKYRGYTNKKYQTASTTYRKPTAAEKKKAPAAVAPVTKKGTGTIVKRSSDSVSKNTVGSKGNILKKSPPSAAPKSEVGTITKNEPTKSSTTKSEVKPKKSTLSPPKNNSPPKTKSKGYGSITKKSSSKKKKK